MKLIKNIFITGLTGSAGSWIGKQILNAGIDLVALVREDGSNHVKDRVCNALSIADYQGSFDRIQVMSGDISQDLCRNNLLAACDSIDAIFHCAASMNFAEEYANRNYTVNVEGTLRMLELAESLKVPFVYISTAYVAGRTHQVVREEPLPEPAEFNNSYEQTKYQAENQVIEWARRTELDAWIFRPSIILGDWQTGRIVNFDAMYQILRFLDMISGRLDGQTLRVGADPDATKNCIPVDYLAQCVWRIFRNADPGIYHITNPTPLPLHKLEAISKSLFDIDGASFVGPKVLNDTQLTKPEILFRRAASVYLPYLQQEPVFDRSRTDAALEGQPPCPVLEVDYFKRIIEYARKVNWGQYQPRPPRTDQGLTVVQSYYDTFLNEKVGRQILPDLKRLSAQFKIYVSDVDNSSRTLIIRQGILEQITLNGEEYECTFTVNFDTFQKIISGRLSPQQAFFRRNIEIEGNIETGLKLATVLSAFFKKYPYKVEIT